MSERELVGAGAIGVLFLLIMLRIPVALAMIATSVGGAYVLSEVAPFLRFAPYLSQFETSLWGIVSNYDLSVVPLFILMGFLASEARLSHDLFHGPERACRAAAWRGGDRDHRSLCGVRGRQRVVPGDRQHDGEDLAARAPPPAISGGIGNRGAGRGRHAGHPDPAIGGPGHLCNRR